MATRPYYLMTALPGLGELGSDPPLGLAELGSLVADTPAGMAIRFVLLGDDLRQRLSFVAGELTEARPAVLSLAQVQGRDPLPDPWLRDAATGENGPGQDAVWGAYWRRGLELGRSLPGRFLAHWVPWELGLQNALVLARARMLALSGSRYTVEVDPCPPAESYDELVSAWLAAPDPLMGQHLLLRARWDWLSVHDAWFSFTDDELVVYAVRLSLLHQWAWIAPARGGARGRGAAAMGGVAA